MILISDLDLDTKHLKVIPYHTIYKCYFNSTSLFFSPTGMIAIDQDGHVAAGTSTNGLTHKVPGYAEQARGTKTRIYCICQFNKIVLGLKSMQHNSHRFSNVCLQSCRRLSHHRGRGVCRQHSWWRCCDRRWRRDDALSPEVLWRLFLFVVKYELPH